MLRDDGLYVSYERRVSADPTAALALAAISSVRSQIQPLPIVARLERPAHLPRRPIGQLITTAQELQAFVAAMIIPEVRS